MPLLLIVIIDTKMSAYCLLVGYGSGSRRRCANVRCPAFAQVAQPVSPDPYPSTGITAAL